MIIDLDNSNTRKALALFFSLFKLVLNEKHYRLLLGGFVVHVLGNVRGAIKWLSELTGTNRDTISAGKKEILRDDPHVYDSRVRRAGAGRKLTEVNQPDIVPALHDTLAHSIYGNPQDEKGRIYSSLSLQKIVDILRRTVARFRACPETIRRIMIKLGYSKQQNKKALQCGKPHEGRDEQMRNIQETRKLAKRKENSHNPVISVDAKAKVFLNNLWQSGKQWLLAKNPIRVKDHDYPETGKKATPYGIYDIINNIGFVNLGLSNDTAVFAVESIRQWWKQLGSKMYPNAEYLTILCDGGGSNGYRLRLWKYELAKLVHEIGLPILVQHYPSGCSKFNPVEHRMFNIMSMNWAGQPFTDANTVLEYIRSTTTTTGLSIEARLDTTEYKKGIRVPDKVMERIIIEKTDSLGFWNYLILGFSDLEPSADAA